MALQILQLSYNLHISLNFSTRSTRQSRHSCSYTETEYRPFIVQTLCIMIHPAKWLLEGIVITRYIPGDSCSPMYFDLSLVAMIKLFKSSDDVFPWDSGGWIKPGLEHVNLPTLYSTLGFWMFRYPEVFERVRPGLHQVWTNRPLHWVLPATAEQLEVEYL